MMWWIAGGASILTVAGLIGLDHQVALWSRAVQPGEWLFGRGTQLLDLLLLKKISDFLLGGLLLIGAAIALAVARTRKVGWSVLYLASVQLSATVIAELAKPQFGRVRPYDAMADGRAVDLWFAGANAFPSGHAAFYSGLFFPLLLILPRWTLWWLLCPLFIGIARVVQHRHYLSDVTASIALAAVLAITFQFLLRDPKPWVAAR
jgi:membrane-associated phospholipid phosphatase